MKFTRCKLPELPEIRLEEPEHDDNKIVVYVGRHSATFDRAAVIQIFENCGYMDADSDFARSAVLKQHTIGIVNALCLLEMGKQPFDPMNAFNNPNIQGIDDQSNNPL